MKVFIAHNYYQNPGGEDGAFKADADILEQHGHAVHRYTQHNDAINEMSKLRAARATLWNQAVYDELKALFTRERFDVAHFHNTFPLISPAAYYAARDAGVPVVQTLHNFRLVCPKAILYRDDRVCEDCLGKLFALPGILHSCYRDSRAQSAAVAVNNAYHRLRGTWQHVVTRYISLTEFARQKFIQAGFSADKIVVRPNFLQTDPGMREGVGEYALFVGRLNPEKGVHTLLEAWRLLDAPIPLKIVGSGPLLEETRAQSAASGLEIELIEWLQPEQVIAYIKKARFLLFPSQWYETFGRVIIEAFACGVPVIASNIGAPSELIAHDRTGFIFQPGDARALAANVIQLWSQPETVMRMGRSARAEFEQKYTVQQNYTKLIDIYNKAVVRV